VLLQDSLLLFITFGLRFCRRRTCMDAPLCLLHESQKTKSIKLCREIVHLKGRREGVGWKQAQGTKTIGLAKIKGNTGQRLAAVSIEAPESRYRDVPGRGLGSRPSTHEAGTGLHAEARWRFRSNFEFCRIVNWGAISTMINFRFIGLVRKAYTRHCQETLYLKLKI
jgi:hypothetical protein